MISEYLKILEVELVGTAYLPLGEQFPEKIMNQIISSDTDLILNSINGDSNISFFEQLNSAYKSKQKPSVLSFSITEGQTTSAMIGSYSAWNYFQSLDNPKNQQFIQDYRKKYGKNSQINDPMVSAYSGVHLWANTVKQALSVNTDVVRLALSNQSILSPMGILSVEQATQHVWKTPMIGKLDKHQHFKLVWQGNEMLRPNPFPLFKSKQQWQEFLELWYQKWSKHWRFYKPKYISVDGIKKPDNHHN